MRHISRTSILDSDVVSAWQEQIAAAVKTPGLLPELVRRRDELLPRFAAHYTYLRALPRRLRRALQRQWHLPLAGVALMLALGQSPALAATIPVNASCTLIDAITAANTDSAKGGCPAGNGADTIVLPPGSTQTLTTVNNSTYGPNGLPVITSAITIEGNGSTIARAASAPAFRLLAVSPTGDLTLERLTLTGGLSPSYSGGGVLNQGTINITESTITGNTTTGLGGGLLNSAAELSASVTITASIISGNTAAYGGGGGIGNFEFGSYYGDLPGRATVTITASTITGNTGSGSYGQGGGVLNYTSFSGQPTVMITGSTISGNTGGGVHNYTFRYGSPTVTITGSTISGNTGSGVASFNDKSGNHSVTITESIITGNTGAGVSGDTYRGRVTVTIIGSTISDNGGGVGSYSDSGLASVTISSSTISGNTGGGVASSTNYQATVTINASTISGNTGGGMYIGPGNDGRATVSINSSTITGNTATSGAGLVAYSYYGQGTLTLTRSLVTGNVGAVAPEILNNNFTVTADAFNLFGVNGNAGIVGFTPGPTDIVPPAGIQLTNILNPVLAFNGGPTQTHALVSGSPAIDAGGAVCTDANGNPLLTDQRGKPRPIDGNGDGTARCDIGAFEFFPVVNSLVTLAPDLETSFNPTPVPGAPAGTFTIGATFTNTSSTALRFPFFTVTELSGGNLLLNAEEGPRSVGATVTPNVGDQMLSASETVQVNFIIGLQASAPFTFFVDLFAEPLVSGASTSRHRPTVTTKGVRR